MNQLDSSHKALSSKRMLLYSNLCASTLIFIVSFVILLIDHFQPFESSKVLPSILDDGFVSSVLLFQVSFNFVVLLSIHLFVGLVSWWVACQLFQKVKEIKKRVQMSLLVLLLLYYWAFFVNVYLYPRSFYAWPIRSIIGQDAQVLETWCIILSIAIGFLLVSALVVFGFGLMARSGKRVLLPVAVICSLLVLSVYPFVANSYKSDVLQKMSYAGDKPNIIILGIDSFRPDMLINDQVHIPFIKSHVDNSVVFENAVTPLPRTFAAWMSILTGKNPKSNGIRFNLFDMNSLETFPRTLARSLSEQGYQTIYATDERRFSNIDEHYGYHQIIGPSAGAADFLLAVYNDLPITNIVSNTWIGKYLLPFQYANRAAYITYKPNSFLSLLDEGINIDNQAEGVFINIHFCLAHWPFLWSDLERAEQSESNQSRDQAIYHSALETLDKQLSQTFELLDRKGILNNSIVLLMSDHGEEFLSENLTFMGSKDGKLISFASRGHGTSIVSESQYNILMAYRFYGENDHVMPKRVDQPASLIDVAPTIMSLLNVDDDMDYDGISLRPWIEGRERKLDRKFFLETGYYVPSAVVKEIDETSVLAEGAVNYRVNEYGRLVLKADSVVKLMKEKQYGVKSGDLLFALIPNQGEYQEVIIDYHTGQISQLGDVDRYMELKAAFCEFYADDLFIGETGVCEEPS